MGVFRSGDGDREAFFYRKLQKVVKTEGNGSSVLPTCVVCVFEQKTVKSQCKK